MLFDSDFTSLSIWQLSGPLLASVFGLRLGKGRSATVLPAVADQLSKLGEALCEPHQLQAVAENSPQAAGWNRLIEQARYTEALRQVEQALGGSDSGPVEQARLILDSVRDGLLITDRENKIQYANQALPALLRQTPQAIFRNTQLENWLPLERPANRSAWNQLGRLIRRAHVLEFQWGAEPAEGVLRVEVTPITGDEHSLLWNFRDITQTRLAEEARYQFVNTATHELRIPLANLKASAETILTNQQIDLEKQKEFLNIIHSEASRLARFVDELLNISQMESGGLSLNKSETDLSKWLDLIVAKIQPLAAHKQILFQAKFPAKLLEVRLDKDKLMAAVINLLGNAVKYTEDGGTVLFEVEQSREEVKFRIEDTGIGINPGELPFVFDKFFRSQDDRVQNIPGNGLGLAFSQEVARLHGGTLTVTSELNRGTAFTLRIPST